MKEQISEEKIRELFEKYTYYAEDFLIWRTYLGLNKIGNKKISPGQDIYGLCLDGPPGSGKSEYAKTYTKILKEMYGKENVKFIGYQCDPTTGKTELYEDLNIIATVVDKDRDKIIIPGVISKAIKAVNEGKKVVLFLDEYDKSREETDAFLLQFLQDGRINTTQYGELEIKEEYKNNLQVILCKNDVRKDLSNQLYRRVHVGRLDYMKPEKVYTVVQKKLIDGQINEDKALEEVVQFVTLLYQDIYKDRVSYMKLPSCSEILIAVEEMDFLMKYSHAPKGMIYETLINDLFKYADDIKTFEAKIKVNDSYKTRQIIENMKEDSNRPFQEDSLNSLIVAKALEKETKEIMNMKEEFANLIKTYKKKFEEMEELRRNIINKELHDIELKNGVLKEQHRPKPLTNFYDETKYIKRGQDVFAIADDWTEIASIKIPSLNHEYFIECVKNNASQLGIILYENGLLITENDPKIIAIATLNDNKELEYKILSSSQIIPSNDLNDIHIFIKLINNIYKEQEQKMPDYPVTRISEDQFLDEIAIIKISTLLYNDTALDLEQETENVYNFDYQYSMSNINAMDNLLSTFKSDNFKQASLEEGKVKKYV